MQNNPISDATSANIVTSNSGVGPVTGSQELNSPGCDGSSSLPEPQPGSSSQACSATSASNNQNQNQQQQQQQSVQSQSQPRSSESPAQQFQASSQQQQAMISLLPSDPSGLNAPTAAGLPQHQNTGPLQFSQPARQRGYQNHQRHAQSYHNQHSMQHHGHLQHHYHHNQQPSLHQAGKFRSPNESNINHVLLITVINPQYTVDCDLMHQLCSPYGKVNRIVIFKKNGVQSMVEFDSVEAAKRAKSILNGHDIYSGCCTLRIEYAKPTRLNVHKNDSESYDYTDPNLSLGSESAATGGQGEHSVHSISFDASAVGQHPPISHQHEQNSMHAHHDHDQHHQHQHHHQGQQSHRIGGRLDLSDPIIGAPGPHQRQQSSQLNHDNQGTDESNYSMSSNPMDQQQPPQSQPPGQGGDISFDSDGRGGFNTSRGAQGGPSQGGAGGGAGYPGIDPYMPVEGLHNHPNPYSRQEGHQHHRHHQAVQHNQHHHPRSSIGPPHGNRFSGSGAANAILGGPSGLVPPQGTVMMVYGLQTDKMTCDRLFNLFCLYGNVVKVKFLRTKEGCAMIQMGDVLAVDRCVSSLNKIILFGGELQISYSKQLFLNDVLQPFALPNGSPSFKDFMSSKNNRFKNPELASKNRILPPSQMLHFFNAPFGIGEEELLNFFKQSSGHDPVSIKIFTPKAENSKSNSGLVVFKDPAEATETLVMCNHLTITKQGAPHPHILRLCFSPPAYNRPPPPPPQSASVAYPVGQSDQ